MKAFGWVCALLLAGQAHAQERILDEFEQPQTWRAVVSDGVKGTISSAPGKAGQGMRFDFDFGSAAGYAAAQRTLPIEFGDDFAISFWIRAEAPLNNFELKLVDASGDNVWWVSRPNFAISREWQKVTFKKRHVSFAWGPTRDRSLRRTEKVEFVVSAGRDGGHGAIFIDGLSIRPIVAQGPAPTPRVSASTGAPQASLLDRGGAPWSGGAGPQALTIDFVRPREFGGVVLHWGEGAGANIYEVQFSDDGQDWRTVRRVVDGNGGTDPLMLRESETRFVRLKLEHGEGKGYRIDRVEIKDLAFGDTANAFFQALAKAAPPGHYPRGMSGQQNYWTVLGVDGGRETGLISEDGAIELARAGFTVEPFVIEAGKLASWADVKIVQSLQDGYLPIPSVTWTAARWRLSTTAFAHGSAAQSQLLARYRLTNTSSVPLALRLALALRPFQVNPPMQFLNTPPGVSPIRSIAWKDGAFQVNGADRVFALTKPDQAGVSSFDNDAIPSRLSGDGWSAQRSVSDDFAAASGALVYDFKLAPGASAAVDLAMPLNGAPQVTKLSADAAQQQVAAAWRARLNQVTFRLPARAQALHDTLRSSLAHMLMTRDGAALMPGTRSYARSWIRDGAMMSEGLLRLGNEQVARDYARWFAPYQFENGKIPCCVDRRGSDPVPENDSQGEFIFLAAQLWRYTKDLSLAEDMWPRVRAAAAYMEQQRQSERTAANQVPGRQMLFGLLPASISHEGYSAKPMHSNWDNFWGLRGYRDASMLASALGKDAEAARLRAQGDEFERELLASLRLTVDAHKIDYLAGAAELGDFDPTSTTIALSPGGLQQKLPQDLLQGTFTRYWNESVARRDGKREWVDYTPYELRNVAAFIRLGWRGRAHELLDFFMKDRRPAAWNQWAEVVGRDAREPRFVGDMPHGWISSDYIRSALDMFAYERESDQTLLVADGIPVDWLEGEGVSVAGLRTPYGQLDYRMRSANGNITLALSALGTLPQGGIVLRAATPSWSSARTTINGRRAQWRNGELRIRALPATVSISAATTSKARP